MSGLLAAVAGMAAGHLVAAVVNPAASPVVAVGSTVIDRVPTPVKEWAGRTFGTADKPVLLIGVVVIAALLAAGIGLLSRTRLGPALVLLVLLVGLAGAAAVTRPSSGPFDVVPSLLAALAGMAALVWLHSTLTGPATDDASAWSPTVAEGASEGESSPAPWGGRRGTRRAFLTGAGVITVAAVATLAVGQDKAVNPSVPAATDLPDPIKPLKPLPNGIGQIVPGVTPFQTPNDDFYRIDTALVLPRVDADTWTLTIDGEVDHRLRITYADLLAMPMIEKDITLNCVSNEVGGPYISSARFLGVRVRELLERAGVHGSADQILSTSVDGMTISTPVQALLDDRDALLAVAMNGEPLPQAHGFPVRLVTPGLYGFVGATKWIASMTATTYAAEAAYWTERGWATDAPVLTQSRIDTPGNGESRPAGTIAVGGVAWAQGRGITAVQVRVDDGPWREATLGPDAGIDYWRQWYLRWDATPGRHVLTARATDGTGSTQTEQRADPYPSGATGWDSVDVTVD